MKNKYIIACALGIISLVNVNAATLNLSSGPTASATFVQNRNGESVNGLTWGLLVADSSGAFATTTEISNFTGLLTSGAQIGNSRLLFTTNSPATNSLTRTHTDFSVTPNVVSTGAALSLVYTIDAVFPNNGRLAKLIWFDGVVLGGTVDGDGSEFFGVSANSFALPTANNATLTVTATDGQNGPASNIIGIPEPSAALLGALGAFGLLRRRRN